MKIARWRRGGARAPPVLPLASPVAERQGPRLQLFTTSQCLRNLSRSASTRTVLKSRANGTHGRAVGRARASPPPPTVTFFAFAQCSGLQAPPSHLFSSFLSCYLQAPKAAKVVKAKSAAKKTAKAAVKRAPAAPAAADIKVVVAAKPAAAKPKKVSTTC